MANQAAVPVVEVGPISLEDLPSFKAIDREYKCDPYIDAAAKLQAMGREDAVSALRRIAREEIFANRVAILCRMLFTSRSGGEFRPPRLGAPSFVGGIDRNDPETRALEWPLEPIEVVDGVPFVITTGYSIAGSPEFSLNYLGYCVENCEWNGYRYAPKSSKEKEAALAKFLSSPRWKGPLGEMGIEFLTAQIK